MPGIGGWCHELRVPDERATWRIAYHIDGDAVLILDVFSKKTQQTPDYVFARCKDRLRRYDVATAQGGRNE